MAITSHQHPADLHKATAPIVEGVHHVEVATAMAMATATATATALAEVHPQPATLRTGILLRKAIPTLKAILLRKATLPAIHQLLARAPSAAEAKAHSEDTLTANLAHHHREEATRPLHDQVLGTDSRY